MAFLTSPKQMQDVNFGRKHLWDLTFIGDDKPPAPFNSWFPASQVSAELFSTTSHTFNVPLGNLSIPAKLNLDRPLSITFFDDENSVLERWFSAWVEFMFPSDGRKYQGVRHLEDCVRQVKIVRLNSARQEIGGTNTPTIYWVFPDGSLTFLGESDGGIKQYDMQFKIAGFK